MSWNGALNLLLAIGLFGSIGLGTCFVLGHKPNPWKMAPALLWLTVMIAPLYVRWPGGWLLGGALEFNWVGKIVAVLTCAMFVVGAALPASAFGIRRPEKGSWPVGLAATGGLIAFAAFLNFVFPPDAGGTPSAEAIAFQATMPGFQEELFHRAIATLLFARLLAADHETPDAFAFGPAAIASVLWFGILHGMRFSGGELQVALELIMITGLTGLILQYLFARTRSLFWPILAHNAANVSMLFM